MFSVKPPAFAEGGGVIVLPEFWLIAHFLAQCDLQVMARHGFVRGQGRQFIERTLFQCVCIDPIDAMAAFLWIALDITARCVAGRDRHWHRLDVIGQFRQATEIVRQHGIHAGGHGLGLGHQVVSGGGIELRIGAQEGEEVCKTALKADFRDDIFHFRPDARDFALAKLMDFDRRVAGPSRVMLDGGGIDFLTTRKTGETRRGTCMRGIFGLDEAQRVLVGGDRVGNGLKPFGSQALSGFGVHVFGKRYKRLVEIAVGRIGDDLLANLVRHCGQRVFVGGPAGCDAAAHIVDILAEIARHIIQARDPCLGILGGLELCLHGGEDRLGLEAPVAGERDARRVILRIVEV